MHISLVTFGNPQQIIKAHNFKFEKTKKDIQLHLSKSGWILSLYPSNFQLYKKLIQTITDNNISFISQLIENIWIVDLSTMNEEQLYNVIYFLNIYYFENDLIKN